MALLHGTGQQGQRVHGEGGEGDDVEVPGSEPGDVLHRRMGGAEVPQHLPGRADQCLARGGEGGPAAEPVEQRSPHFPLQARDAVGKRRLCDVQGMRSAGEAAAFHHGEKVLKLASLHRAPLSGGRLRLAIPTGWTTSVYGSQRKILSIGAGLPIDRSA